MDQPSDSEQRHSATAGAITIKKYANRRLYNTATSCYVTLDYLSQLVKTGAEFVVYDAKTGEDITRSVLTHIIVEKEAKGHSLLPVSFLRHLISLYGDSLQVLVPRYLEHVMKAFALNQQNMREGMHDRLDGLMPFGRFEEMSKQQMALFERAMQMFNPFFGDEPQGSGKNERAESAPAETQIDELRGRLNSIRKELDALAAERGQKSEH